MSTLETQHQEGEDQQQQQQKHRRDHAGVSRLQAKLKKCVEAKDHYEAHQIYRTLYFRYCAQGNFQEALDLLYQGLEWFFKQDQPGSGSDLALLVLEAFNSIPKQVNDESLKTIAEIFKLFPSDHPTREKFIKKSILWSASHGNNKRGDPSLHHLFGMTFWREKNFSEASAYFILGNDASAVSLAELLIEWSLQGDASELEYFVTRAVLQYLEIKDLRRANLVFETFTMKHPMIKNPPFQRPLLNFTWFLLQVLERDAAPLFKTLREKYSASLSRDPSFETHLDAIGQHFFRIQPGGRGNPMLDMMRNMFGGGGGGLGF